MVTKHLRTLALLLAAFALGSTLLMACARPGTTTANNGGGGGGNGGGATPTQPASCPSGDTVKTGSATFEQPCITLAKGTTLKVVQAQTSFHILDYGQWNNGTAQPSAAPAGAPAMKALQLQGPSVSIGPFNTAGTYHIYCTVHPNMNLMVIVK